MTTIIDKETDTDTMKLVEQCSVRGMSESFAVLDGIKDNSISLAKASEMANAIGKATGCFILTPQLIMNNLFRHRRAMSWREIRQPRLLGLLLRGVRTWNAKRRERAREKRAAAEAAKRAVERSIHLARALRAGAIWRGPARAPFNLTNRTSMHGGIKR